MLFLNIHKTVLFPKISIAWPIYEDAAKSYHEAENPGELRKASLWRQQILVQDSRMYIPDANSSLLLEIVLHC